MVVVAFTIAVMIINPSNTNSGRFIAVTVVADHVHNVHIAVVAVVDAAAFIGTLLQILLWRLSLRLSLLL